ncbi:hypothetical protein Agabi119p4_5829 [Agaricus bisporus var. burnettii]|uniref:Integrase catalytic domain-containing protein n=1 Tax=Agaricus bisporus var. burnettii TaxID=192524 RepID=A0A8H7F2H0_AGABI|nr:hypothetical protein Agabi119p4_5829 [Agaricus bisporus var. burnettii]
MERSSVAKPSSKPAQGPFPYRKVPAMKPVVEVPPMPARYYTEQRKAPSYRHQTQVEEEVDIKDVLARLFGKEVTLTQQELLAMAPRLREMWKEVISKRRVPINHIEDTGEETAKENDEDNTSSSQVMTETWDVVALDTLESPKKIQQLAKDAQGQYIQTWRIDDPIMQYLSTMTLGDREKQVFSITNKDIIAAKGMENLRVIPAIINGVREEEALLDSGSQIVSMSRTAARNITVHLQVHVLEGAAYRVLLGRPFNVITESKILNSQEGKQYINLTDPSTKEQAMLSTYARGSWLEGEAACIISTDENTENPYISEVLPIQARQFEQDELNLLYLKRSLEEGERSEKAIISQYLQYAAQSYCPGQPITAVEPLDNQSDPALVLAKKYKPVALKVKPVLGELPDKFRILRHITGDPLAEMPQLPVRPKDFKPKGRYTQERKEKLDSTHSGDFLWPEERKLMHWMIAEQNGAFAWEDSERGSFKEEYFPAVEIPTVAHTPWVEKHFRIPPAIYEEVCKIIKRKIDTGVYEPSNSSYRSKWFCVVKKDGKSLRLVHSLEPLNRVTIAHSGLPPATEELAMHFAGRACNGILDLWVGYDNRKLATVSRDLTTFQSPFGALRLVTLPMGWTNSVPIFHEDVTYILRDEVPEYTLPYIDDVPIRGPRSRYELEGSVDSYEVLKENSGICRFIYEHFQTVNRILQRMKYAGGTFSGPKTTICADYITIVGFECSYQGRKPSSDAIGKILRWGDCTDTTDVRAFLGTAVQCRNHIPHFVMLASPLYNICKKGVPFEWGPEQITAQQHLKDSIAMCLHTRNPKFPSSKPLVLAVDSSWRGVGYYLYQRDENDQKLVHYVKFNSILMDERQQRYSQPKRELCGLRMALEEEIYLLRGCRNLVVETDAKYLFGMLNNPGKLPNATVNRWVDYIRTHFHFMLLHKKGKSFGPDGLSRRKWYPGNPLARRFDDGSEDGEEDFELVKENPDDEDPLPLEAFVDEIDNRTGYLQQIINDTPVYQLARVATEQEIQQRARLATSDNCLATYKVFLGQVATLEQSALEASEDDQISPYNEDRRTLEAKRQDAQLPAIREWLANDPKNVDLHKMSPAKARFVRAASHFWLDKEGRLFRKIAGSGFPQLVVEIEDRMRIMRECHDKLGHRGAYATSKLIAQRFWWPEVDGDVAWYVKSCHLCQVRQKMALELPPVVTHTPSIFQVLHADTVHMTPPSNGCKYIVHGRCALSSWMEARALRKEDAKAIGSWIFEDIICRWGSLVKIVTDNGSAFRKAVKWLEEKYGIKGVAISPYNSQANGVIERPHWDVRQMLYKATAGDVKKWFWHLHHVAWADRITVRKGTGCSPYFMITGAHPTLPLDIIEATWLVKFPETLVSTADLIGLRAQALAKHVTHVEQMRQSVRVSKQSTLGC